MLKTSYTYGQGTRVMHVIQQYRIKVIYTLTAGVNKTYKIFTRHNKLTQ